MIITIGNINTIKIVIFVNSKNPNNNCYIQFRSSNISKLNELQLLINNKKIYCSFDIIKQSKNKSEFYFNCNQIINKSWNETVDSILKFEYITGSNSPFKIHKVIKSKYLNTRIMNIKTMEELQE